MKPQLILLAGPNGAGKSSYYSTFFGDSPMTFLNADLVAAEMKVDSLEAARMLDATRDRMIDAGAEFITETVFSDPYGAKLAMLRRAVDAGYEVTLIYIGVVNAQLSGQRVAQRVARGGHDVPRDRIAARFARSLENLKKAIAFVQTVELYDNTSPEDPFQPVAVFTAGALTWRMKGRLPAWTRGVVPSARGR